MLFRIALLSLVLCAVLPLEVSAGEVDPNAEPFVRALEAHYRNAKTLKAIFLERYSEGHEGLQAESGTVYFSRPGRMRWEYEAPEAKTFLSDGKTVWLYVPKDHTVTRAPLKQSDDWRSPLALLTGKADLSRLCAKVQISDQLPATAGDVVLLCLPRGEKRDKASESRSDAESALSDPTADFDRVLLEIQPKTGQLADVKVLQPGGIELQYTFGNWQENLPIPESKFHFQAPPGVAIVDGSTDPNVGAQ